METRHTCHFQVTDLQNKGQSAADHRHSTEIAPCSSLCPIPSTDRRKGSGIEDLEGVMSTPTTSNLVVLSHTFLGYRRFYQILMPTVSKIFCTVYPEGKKMQFYNLLATIFMEIQVVLDPQCMAFFIQSSGLGNTQTQN